MVAIPKLMKAVLLKGHGGFDQLEYREDVPVPELDPGEVLIRVGAAGVNNTDINTRTGWYSKAVTEGTTAERAQSGYTGTKAEDNAWTASALKFPRIQGADACGQIVAVGSGVDQARIGERILVDPVLRDRFGYFGADCDGAFAEYTKVASIQIHRIKSPLSDAELASFPCSYSTAENLLTRSNVQRRDRVLITGASGGVGSAVVQLAKRRGAKVVALVGKEKAEQLKALGADEILPRDSDIVSSLGTEAVDVVIDVVGGTAWPKLLEVLRRGGRYAASGAIAGPIVPLDLRTLYLKDLTLFGCTFVERKVFSNLVTYIERGDVKPLVAKTFSLKEIVRAQEEFLGKQFVGKLVLIP
jgi:NADPH:quinone reductase-like Zn-dependent oxidoreductase